MTAFTRAILLSVAMLLAGCYTPSARLDFPDHATERSSRGIFFNVHTHSPADFALLADERGKLDIVAYDDTGSGTFNRKYRLSQYSNEDVPHLMILLDSIPYQKLAEAYAHGRLSWFDPPQKVIPLFPTLTEIIYSKVLGAPPLPGMIDRYYDPEKRTLHDDLWGRVFRGDRESWERRLNYCASMYQSGQAYLNPRPWLAGELHLAKETFDASPDPVTLVYFTSASAMMSRYGEKGFDEIIDAIERLCLRVLYDRQGAVKISIFADHGHNLKDTKNFDLNEPLKAAGFHPSDRISGPNDVVLEINGLVTYAAVRTHQPEKVALALTADPRIELAAYLDGERVIICNSRGSAYIECRGRRVRYVPIDCDVLEYQSVVKHLRESGKADADGFVSDEDWFSATLNHEYPDAPRRLWDAFHGAVVHPPEVMVVIRDGYCAGRSSFENFIHMASTHGGLNQINSATFIMTMTGRANRPIRSKEILPTIEPGFTPVVRN